MCATGTSVRLSAAPLLDLETAVLLALRQNRELSRLAAAHEAAGLERELVETEFAVRLRPAAGIRSSGGVQTRQAGWDLLKKTEWGTQLEIGGALSQADLPGSDFAARVGVRAGVSQPLFRYAGRLANREGLERATGRVRTALRTLELKKSDIALSVIRTGVELHRLEQQARAEETARRRLDRLLRLTQVRIRQGRATRVDALRVESQVGDADSRARAVRERRDALLLDLADLLGMEPDAVPALAPPSMPEDLPPPIGEALAAARDNRLDLAQVQQDYRDVERGLRVARRLRLPDLKLVTSVEQYGEGESMSRTGGLDETNWFIGLQVDGDLGAGREGIAYRQAQLDERTAREDIETALLLIERQVRRQILALEHARAETGLAERHRVVAENRLRLAQRLLEMGRGDVFTVTDAEQQFHLSESALLQARSEAALAAVRLRHVLGTLIETPAELKPGAQ